MSTSFENSGKYENLTESKAAVLFLSRGEAAALRDLGRSFAALRSSQEKDEEQANESEASVLECVRFEEADRSEDVQAYKVTVWNRIGAIQLGDRTLLIRPKIEFDHFIYVSELAIGDPQIRERDPLVLEPHQSFRDLIARWFLNAVDRLIPNHLIRDYYEQLGVLPAVRGAVNPIATTRRFYHGRLDVVCRYDTFELDHALNRILKEACLRVANFETLTEVDRRRARSKANSMPEVGPFGRGDLIAKPDRRAISEGYTTPINLARSIIASEGRSIEGGRQLAYAFLQFTPSIIEEGIRNILRLALGEICEVNKRSYEVQPLKSATPDLVFSRSGRVEVVGDVKYKVAAEWGRLHDDVYQSIYFATAAEVHRSLVVAFTNDDQVALPQLRVGKNTVDGVLWGASKNVSPEVARRRFVDDVRSLLTR